MWGVLLLMILLPLPVASQAADKLPSLKTETAILPVDTAFRIGAYVEGDVTRVFWQVMPGYFLYRDKFVFHADTGAVQVVMDEGVLRQDEIFGEVRVLDGLVEAVVPVTGLIQVEYQGCADNGFCYPPQKKQLNTAKVQVFP